MKPRISRAALFVLLMSIWPIAYAVWTECAVYVQQHGYADMAPLGAAYNWWDAAPGKRHGRGSEPLAGAVLVWKGPPANSALPNGHVALVKSINVNGDSRKITVDHANWHNPLDGVIRTGVTVTDVSSNNDWTSVKVGTDSTAFNTYGFIYPVCKRGDGSCTMNRVGSIAWYPAISKCSNASQWFYVNNSDPITFRIGPSAASLCPENCPTN